MARLTATSGALDNTFDTDGRVLTDVIRPGTSFDWGYGLSAYQSNGKLVMTGSTDVNGGDFVVVRYNTDGSLDTSFDTDGYITIDGSLGSNFNFVQGMEINSAEQALVWFQNNSDYRAFRLTSSGSLDTGFDGDGFYDPGSVLLDMAFQADNKVLAVGGLSPNWIRRLNTNGSLDVASISPAFCAVA